MNEYYERYEIFRKNMSSLKETSLDNDNGRMEYMTNSSICAVDFDGVKESYIKNMALSITPCSADALYISEKGEYSLIEFKNGKMNKNKIFNVNYKIYDSLFILTDILEEGISFCRQNVDFILVYNEMKNAQEEQDSQEEIIEASKVTIGKYFSRKAKKPFIRFNLERFQNLYFRRVYTYTEKEFEEEFIQCCGS